MFTLRVQFFVAMLIICSLLTFGLNFIIKFNFHQDFWHYIEKKETRFAQPLIDDLVKQYRTNKNWLWVNHWEDYTAQQLSPENRERDHREQEPHTESPVDDEHPLDGPPHPSAINNPHNHDLHEWREHRLAPPVRDTVLLDTQRRFVAGKNQPLENMLLIPLTDNDTAIGYLGIPLNPALRDMQDSHFAQAQERKLTVIIVIALILASLASIPLSHFLTKRIDRLVAQVRRMSTGNYHEKIAIDGRDEINILGQHLNDLAETLAQSEQTRRQWVADISHELRTPLAVLQAELEAMEDGVRTLDKLAIARLLKHSQRLKHLVSDLYELSLTDVGGLTYRKTNLNLAMSLRDAIHTMQPQFAQQHLTLLSTIDNHPMTLFGDAERLQQLFSNLLKNSLQYTNSPGTTKVTLHRDNHSAIITIEDSAPGVNEEHHEKLFDRLYRADSSRNRATGGAGLGLSICKNIVAAHDGQISISNSELGGLRVVITLPLLGVKI